MLSGEGLPLTEANWALNGALYQASGWARGVALAEILHAAVAPYVVLDTEGLGGAADSEVKFVSLLEASQKGEANTAVTLLNTNLDGAAADLLAFFAREGRQ